MTDHATGRAASEAGQRLKRFPQLALEDIAPEGQDLAKEIIQISSVGLGGPYNVMLRSPIFADRMKRLLDYLRFHSPCPPDSRSLPF